jgi:hypothetical protein
MTAVLLREGQRDRYLLRSRLSAAIERPELTD